MPDDKKGSGFQSAAGLIRYFDEEEDRGLIFDPKLVLYIAVIFGVVIELLKVFWPLWPFPLTKTIPWCNFPVIAKEESDKSSLLMR